MNTVQMECFIAVYQTLSFSKAANRLHLSQPAVSHQIISMENELETSLFVRTNKFVTPTQQAKQIRPHIEHILEIQKNIQSELATPGKLQYLLKSVAIINWNWISSANLYMNF